MFRLRTQKWPSRQINATVPYFLHINHIYDAVISIWPEHRPRWHVPEFNMTAGFLGILSLDTAFPRIPGDIGNPASYPFPARVHVVQGADSAVIVKDRPPPPDLLNRFVEGAQKLEAEGAKAIVSTCGFLITSQAEIAGAVNIPVMLSALSLVPVVQATCPGQIGILTASAASLGPNARCAAGLMGEQAVIAGLEHVPEFADTFLAPKSIQRSQFDREAMQAAVVATAQDLVARHPHVSALLLECGNLPPYADALREAVKRPVFHLGDAATFLMAA